MKTVFNLNGVEFGMSSRFMGCVSNVWKGDRNSHNKFVITITAAGGRTSFTFYGSAADCWAGVTELDESGLKGALECFLSDASCYDCARDFEDFCSELGYDRIEDYKQARAAYNGCKRHSAAASRVFGSDTSLIWDALTE